MIVWLEGAQDGSFLGWSEGCIEGMVGGWLKNLADGVQDDNLYKNFTIFGKPLPKRGPHRRDSWRKYWVDGWR